MLIIALVLALIGLVALVFAVVTSNQLVAWVCIGASVLGVILLIVDAIRERQQRDSGAQAEADDADDDAEEIDDEPVDYPEEAEEAEVAEEADEAPETREAQAVKDSGADETAK
ncbi:hypothetical protein [Mycobacterium vicinigordonae]|uniref:Transmembrane protein n=1 Tax=Mycobacterium vicinigordonae TaxID=1719132 RepID=A0A7D6E0H7_9MYCO|nr:hypothetical protein H0P51_16770 [Mycobacterium vicinigordonae]